MARQFYGDIFPLLLVIYLMMVLVPDAQLESALNKEASEAFNSSGNNQVEFFKHIRWLTNRFVDYKYFCSSEYGKHSPYAIQDLNSAASNKNPNRSLNDLKTKNIWILRNKKCMNFSNVKMNYYEASRVCTKNHFKQTRLLHRTEMKFLLKNSNSHYKGINIYNLYAKLNKIHVTPATQTNERSKRSEEWQPTDNNYGSQQQTYREFVFLPKSQYLKQSAYNDRQRNTAIQKPSSQKKKAEDINPRKAPVSLLASKPKPPSPQPSCEEPVQDFQIWLNDDNTIAGFECSTIDKAPVIKFNSNKCKNGCYDCVPRNSTQAYFICAKNCDWKVPFGSFCNTMNRNELYLYENLYFQQDELIYLCQGQLECIDYTCKCPKPKQRRREHFCE